MEHENTGFLVKKVCNVTLRREVRASSLWRSGVRLTNLRVGKMRKEQMACDWKETAVPFAKFDSMCDSAVEL